MDQDREAEPADKSQSAFGADTDIPRLSIEEVVTAAIT
jgi:hypothetical protein